MATQLNITVIEDHDALRAVTVEALRQQGHEVQGIPSAEALDCEAAGRGTDIFIIDINLPGEDGLSLSRRIRQHHPRAGIIMASGRTQVDDRVAGYESGADVYLSKPVALAELLAAVSSVNRRLDSAQPDELAAREPAFVVDSRSMLLQGPARAVVISRAELQMLSAFSASPGQQLEYRQLVELLGHAPDEFRKASLEVKMVRLRKKLIDAGAGARCLRAVRMVGYQVCVPLHMR